MSYIKMIWIIVLLSVLNIKGASVAVGKAAIINDDLHFEELSEEEPDSAAEETDTGLRKNRESVKPIQCQGLGRVAIPNDCTQFFSCSKAGETATLSSCPAGKSFHHQMRSCMKMTTKECHQFMCKTKGEKFVDPHSKYTYLTCENMYPEVKKCLDGETFSESSLSCEGEKVKKRNPEEPDDFDEALPEEEGASRKQLRHVDQMSEIAESILDTK